jgi:hypothetical protein
MVVNYIAERAFEDIFMHMVAGVLPVKKGVVPADRIVKFIRGYTKFINEKGAVALYSHHLLLQTYLLDSCSRRQPKQLHKMMMTKTSPHNIRPVYLDFSSRAAL